MRSSRSFSLAGGPLLTGGSTTGRAGYGAGEPPPPQAVSPITNSATAKGFIQLVASKRSLVVVTLVVAIFLLLQDHLMRQHQVVV